MHLIKCFQDFRIYGSTGVRRKLNVPHESWKHRDHIGAFNPGLSRRGHEFFLCTECLRLVTGIYVTRTNIGILCMHKYCHMLHFVLGIFSCMKFYINGCIEPRKRSWVTKVHTPKVGALKRALDASNKVTTNYLISLCTPISYVSFSRPTAFPRLNCQLRFLGSGSRNGFC